ncbi:MAG: hypothetical protein ACRCZD_21925, partial [Phycicoccus sp.]
MRSLVGEAVRPRSRAVSDLRLVGPAVLAWAGSAALLGAAPRTHLIVAGLGAVAAVAVVAATGPAVRRLRAGGPVRTGASTATAGGRHSSDGPRWVVALGLVLLTLLQVAAAAQHAWSGRAEVAALAAERASVAATVVVTGDPQVVGAG